MRVMLYAAAIDTGGDADKAFDMMVRESEVDVEAQTLTLSLAGDELLLQDFARLYDDLNPRDYETSLRDVVEYVLGQVYYPDSPGLEPSPGDDADVTAYWELQNLFRDPSAVGTANFDAGSGASALTTSTTVGGYVGSGALRWTAASGVSNLVLGNATKGYVQVTPGRSYNVSTYIRSSTARDAAIGIQWYDGEGVQISSAIGSYTTTSTANWNTRIDLTALAPVGASFMRPYVSTVTNSAGQFHYIDGIVIVEDDELVPFFYGSSSDANYTYSWEGTTSDSVSLRVPTVDRPPELFTWDAGQTAWDFLEPLCTSVGLRLFWHNAGGWFLFDPLTYTNTDHSLAVTADNATKGTDTVNRDNADLFCTGVVCIYTWENKHGFPRRKVNSAGTSEKVLVFEYDNTVYPGPGAAAAILAARVDRGRVQDVEVLGGFEFDFAQEVTIALPGMPDTIGLIESIEWDLATGLMTVGCAGLEDV
jgi:hypothetical protein